MDLPQARPIAMPTGRGRSAIVKLASALAAQPAAWLCAAVTVGLMLLGIAAINIAESAGGSGNSFWLRQAAFALVATAIMAATARYDYRKLGRIAYPAFGVTLAVLALLVADRWVDLPAIPQIRGARRWIRLGPVQLQPSEFAKITYVLALAWYLRYRKNYRRLTGLLGPLLLTLLPMFLILLEPDLGTVLLMLPVMFCMLFAAGANRKHLAAIAMICLLAMPALYGAMRDYQRMRLLGPVMQFDTARRFLLSHERLLSLLRVPRHRIQRWPVEGGYQLAHSKTALATGGLFGASDPDLDCLKYNFLPDRHNDFIFAVIGHKWGLAGCLAVLAAYGVLVWQGCRFAAATNEPFGKLLAVGVVSLLATQTLINVGMTVGLLPITGMTLPFVSYGGSSLLANAAAAGAMLSVGLRRPIVLAPEPFVFERHE